MFYVLMNSSGTLHKATSLQRKTQRIIVSMLLLLFPRSLVLEKGFSCSSMLNTSKSSCTDISLIAHQQERPPYQPDPAQGCFLYLYQRSIYTSKHQWQPDLYVEMDTNMAQVSTIKL